MRTTRFNFLTMSTFVLFFELRNPLKKTKRKELEKERKNRQNWRCSSSAWAATQNFGHINNIRYVVKNMQEDKGRVKIFDQTCTSVFVFVFISRPCRINSNILQWRAVIMSYSILTSSLVWATLTYYQIQLMQREAIQE